VIVADLESGWKRKEYVESWKDMNGRRDRKGKERMGVWKEMEREM